MDDAYTDGEKKKETESLTERGKHRLLVGCDKLFLKL